MADAVVQELNERFAPHNDLSADVLRELQSILNLHSISAQELFYKWESYSLKMGLGDAALDLKSTRDLKKDIQDALERESRIKSHGRASEKRAGAATPRNVKSTAGDAFGMLEGVVPSTPRAPMAGVTGNSVKRKTNFETPATKASKMHANSSPGEFKTPTGKDLGAVPFSQRQNAGKIDETLNGHIVIPGPPIAPFSEPRIKLKANTDVAKLSYKSMAMKLSDASAILDERIDEFRGIIQKELELEDTAFGNPAMQSTSEIVTVGRICCDAPESKLMASSVVLETSRKTGSGHRVPLKLDGVSSFDLFPGKIVALRGSNASGEYFKVSEVLRLPLLPPAVSPIHELDTVYTRVSAGNESEAPPQPLNIIVSSGPYTSDTSLSYEALHELCERAVTTSADALILTGPFLDVEHPLVASGAFASLPELSQLNPYTASLLEVFQCLISQPLQQLAQRLPSVTIILVPSVRDAIHKHVSWPQDRMARKELRLPKQATVITNPVFIALNELIFGISSQDILYELRQEEVVQGDLPDGKKNMLARLSGHLIEQRHFFPLHPSTARQNLPRPTPIDGEAPAGLEGEETERFATGAMLDVPYLGLGEWVYVRPDVLITPSALAPFAKVVQNVVVINPGTLSKKRGAGTFAQMYVKAIKPSDEERTSDGRKLHDAAERARVDVIRI